MIKICIFFLLFLGVWFSNEKEEPKETIVFSLKKQENMYTQLIMVLQNIIKNKPLEPLLFLYQILKNNSPKKVLEILYINEQILNILAINEDQLASEITNLKKSLEEEELFKKSMENTKISQQYLNKFIRLLVITKSIVLQKYQADGFYSTNYSLENLNVNKYFVPKKIFYIYFLNEKQINNNNLKVEDKVMDVNNIENFKNQLNTITNNNFVMLKNFDQYDHLTPHQYIIKKVTIDKEVMYQVILCYENIEEQINNVNFSLTIVKLTSSLSEDFLNEILRPLNNLPLKELFFFLNQMIVQFNLKIDNYETHHDVGIESFVNNAELFNIVANFPRKKYVLINQETYYILYLIFASNNNDNNQFNIKSPKAINDYIIKNLI